MTPPKCLTVHSEKKSLNVEQKPNFNFSLIKLRLFHKQSNMGLIKLIGAMINDIRAICTSYKMIAYIMIFVHNDRLRTVHDDIQTVKIYIQ